MKALVLLAGALAVACAPARTSTAPVPTPAPAPATAPSGAAPATATAPPRTADEPPTDWHLLDLATDGYAGISLRRAEKELLAGRRPQRQVVVAVIDGGVDTAHTALRASLWTNPKEAPGTDGDGDGLAGDVRGWNYIGGRDGRDVDHDTYELTRLHARCARKALGGDSLSSLCPTVNAEFTRARANAEREAEQVRAIANALDGAVAVLRGVVRDSLTPARVRAVSSSDPRVQQARALYLQFSASGATPRAVAEAKADVESQLRYKLNADYDTRAIVGDRPDDLTERVYGNADVMGPDAQHGTHVSGIIASRGEAAGIAPPDVKVMMVRAVPDGDERDKDIGNAIRYAVDHGAQIINMSFGKAWSPQKGAVDDAVRYAESKGVLLVHAAGNEGENIGKHPSFPTPFYVGGGRAGLWLEVGASSWRGGDRLAADFSNWDAERVDLFAPGADIYSTVPGGYERLSGTSMAAPVVSGVAALLMSYFPELTAADVKRVLLASATRFANQKVVRPGTDDERVNFSALSATGGIVNVYQAVKMVLEKRM